MDTRMEAAPWSLKENEVPWLKQKKKEIGLQRARTPKGDTDGDNMQ